eukprot:scaffold20260_cov54-Attheya_sp.AAC.1
MLCEICVVFFLVFTIQPTLNGDSACGSFVHFDGGDEFWVGLGGGGVWDARGCFCGGLRGNHDGGC